MTRRPRWTWLWLTLAVLAIAVYVQWTRERDLVLIEREMAGVEVRP